MRKRGLLIPLIMAFAVAVANSGQASEGIIVRCGASSGQGYFPKDDLMNPTGPDWGPDGISSGKIVLVNLGSEWDIQFDDAIGASGYRNDGARVLLLSHDDRSIMVGAFNANYVDIYTFDLKEKEVVWSSNKLGPIRKFAVYVAPCE